MTKARTQGAKRRAKREKSQFDLADIPARQPDGRRRPTRQERDPTETAITARARQVGEQITRETITALRDPVLCDPAGHAIWLECQGQERKALGDILHDLTRAYVSQCRAIGINPFAKCGKVEYMPDRFEARDDDRPDLRTPEERYRAAIRAWSQWHGRVGSIPTYMQRDLWDGIYLRRDMTKDGRATIAGRAFVAAMRSLRNVIPN